MKDYINSYAEYLKNVKRVSQNTFEAYMRDINQFVSYCTANGVKGLNTVTEGFISSYIKSLNKSASTSTRITASIRNYFRFLLSEGVVKSDPTAAIKTKRAEKQLPDILESNEVLKLLSQPNGNDYKSIRDKAMLELLYATGIKVTELIELTIFDINLQIGILNMHNTRHERIVPIYAQAAQHIGEYLQNVRPAIVQNPAEDRLFTNMNGQPLSRQGLWKIIKHYADKAGIEKDITPHTLRHSFATHLLENGAKLSDIKDMLGHSDISSTQIYAQFVKNKYVNTYAKFHPLAKR